MRERITIKEAILKIAKENYDNVVLFGEGDFRTLEAIEYLMEFEMDGTVEWENEGKDLLYVFKYKPNEHFKV